MSRCGDKTQVASRAVVVPGSTFARVLGAPDEAPQKARPSKIIRTYAHIQRTQFKNGHT